jgi:hypothetical protein
VKTRDEAIAYLKSLGLQACERVVSGERVIFVGAEPVVSHAGMMAFKKGVYLRQLKYSWTVVDMSQLSSVAVNSPMSLRQACDTAAALLACELRISVLV